MRSRERIAWGLVVALGSVLFARVLLNVLASLNPPSVSVFVRARNDSDQPVSVIAVDVAKGTAETARLQARESLKFEFAIGESSAEVDGRGMSLFAVNDEGAVIGTSQVNARVLWENDVHVRPNEPRLSLVPRQDPWTGPVRRRTR